MDNTNSMMERARRVPARCSETVEVHRRRDRLCRQGQVEGRHPVRVLLPGHLRDRNVPPGHEDTLRSEKRSPELLVRASIHAAPRYGGADARPGYPALRAGKPRPDKGLRFHRIHATIRNELHQRAGNARPGRRSGACLRARGSDSHRDGGRSLRM